MVFRRHSSSLPTAAALDEEGLKIGAALAWISQQGNLDDFPGSRNERMALTTTAIRRGLVAWDRGHDRYRLTQLGKTQAACYSPNISPNIKSTKGPAQDSPVVKSGLPARLLDRFERRPYTIIAAFFAIGAAVGAAAAWAPSSAPRSVHAANSQTSSDSSVPAVSNALSASISPVTAPQEQAKAAGEPAPPAGAAPAGLPRDEAASTGNAPESVGPRRSQEVDPTRPTPAPRATISGSVAGARAAGGFDRGPSADVTERAASTTKPLDSQAISDPKAVPETPSKATSHHRGRDARARGARRWPNFADESVDRGARRYHSYRAFGPEYNRDDMGLVGWLFH
jgi:hypothetical protein